MANNCNCNAFWPNVDHDPNIPIFDQMSIFPGEVCRLSETNLVATIPNSEMNKDDEVGAHLIVKISNTQTPDFNTLATTKYDPKMILEVKFDETSAPFEAISFRAKLTKELANMLPPDCVQNTTTNSSRPSTTSISPTSFPTSPPPAPTQPSITRLKTNSNSDKPTFLLWILIPAGGLSAAGIGAFVIGFKKLQSNNGNGSYEPLGESGGHIELTTTNALHEKLLTTNALHEKC